MHVLSKIQWALVEMYEEVRYSPVLVHIVFIHGRRVERFVEELSMRAPTGPVTHGCDTPLICPDPV